MAVVTCTICKTDNPAGSTSCVKCGTVLARVAPADSDQGEGAPPERTATQALRLRKGQVIANRYTVLDILGRGGMGAIFKVRDNTLGEEVALKLLLPEHVRDEMVRDRFYNEARIARQLSHNNIVRVHDIGVSGDTVYISMECLPGQSLRDVLDSLPAGKRLPIKTVLHIFDELCAALEYAHRFTVHRDIKPENVMITPDGTVKLMDFGISKLMSHTGLTRASMVMGTPYYMAPEQLKSAAKVDQRADVYSVGVMLYEILTGNVPTGVPKPASQLTREVPPSLDPIVEKCVDPNPEKRYTSISELRADLRRLKETLFTETKVEAAPAEQHRAALRVPVARIAGILLCALIATGAGLALWELEPVATSDANAAGAPPGATAPPASTSPAETYLALAQRARAAVGAENSDRSDLAMAWTAAEENISLAREGGPDAAVAAARALQSYLGILLAREHPETVYIPGGSVILGEGNVVVEPFLMDRFEVTRETFAEFQGSADWRWPDSAAGGDMTLPMTFVSFFDAQAFAAWAKKRLPTEAQWAHAAYGAYNSSSVYPWGEEWQEGARNESGRPQPPGSFEGDLTESGLFDMSGNVMEWTRTEYVQGARRDGGAEEGSFEFTFGTLVVVRGGHFNDGGNIPLHDRAAQPYEAQAPQVGFRCVLPIPADRPAVEDILSRYENR